MPGGPSDSAHEAVRAAEAYFEECGIRRLFTDLLVQLGQDRPKDVLGAIRAYLDGLARGWDKEKASGKEAEEEEEHDADASLLEVDPLRLLAEYHFPGKGPHVDLSARTAWAGGFNRSLLESWVPQPSPCCGCASAAGAFNALWRIKRDASDACTIREVAEIMAAQVEQQQLQKQRRLERLLGVAAGALEPFLAALDARLAEQGLSWTGLKAKAVTKQIAMANARELLRSRTRSGPREALDAPEEEAGGAGAELPPVDVFEALREVLCQERQEEEEEEAPEEELENVAATSVGSTKWGKEVSELLVKRKGVLRLRAERPNTSEVGSGGLRTALLQLAQAREEQLKVSCLMARKGSMAQTAAPLTKADGAEAVHAQWAALKAAFGLPGGVLLFHLTNHYALVFAWREWLEDEADPAGSAGSAALRRQILTARRGQRPSAWMDFEEVREILLGWKGYALLHVKRA
ncbi:unnamed protein product [Effrenium voratum]|uniref:Uncharacterized protein n=1 Tax=Effrenium voratum TaxID=2562239 RepID=A0AA36HSV7_9DINO|nr:unnamed protein product [Effrenium voratum]